MAIVAQVSDGAPKIILSQFCYKIIRQLQVNMYVNAYVRKTSYICFLPDVIYYSKKMYNMAIENSHVVHFIC